MPSGLPTSPQLRFENFFATLKIFWSSKKSSAQVRNFFAQVWNFFEILEYFRKFLGTFYFLHQLLILTQVKFLRRYMTVWKTVDPQKFNSSKNQICIATTRKQIGIKFYKNNCLGLLIAWTRPPIGCVEIFEHCLKFFIDLMRPLIGCVFWEIFEKILWYLKLIFLVFNSYGY